MSQPSVSRMVEDYVTLIWKAYEWPDSTPTTTDLAESLGVTPSTVSANLKKLARDGLISYKPYGPISLTEEGRRIAVDIVRRHRIIETYLVERLGLTWDQVHDEADRMEHAVSDLVLDRMDDALGNPTADPHGDPIPARDGTVQDIDSLLLADAPAGAEVVVLRVSDRHPEILRYLTEKGVTIGHAMRVERRADRAGLLHVRLDEDLLELTTASARDIRVRIR